jgi:hypothetical protein
VVRRVVSGQAVRLSSCSTARRIRDETERIVAAFTTVTPNSDARTRAPVGPLIVQIRTTPAHSSIPGPAAHDWRSFART